MAGLPKVQKYVVDWFEVQLTQRKILSSTHYRKPVDSTHVKAVTTVNKFNHVDSISKVLKKLEYLAKPLDFLI